MSRPDTFLLTLIVAMFALIFGTAIVKPMIRMRGCARKALSGIAYFSGNRRGGPARFAVLHDPRKVPQ